MPRCTVEEVQARPPRLSDEEAWATETLVELVLADGRLDRKEREELLRSTTVKLRGSSVEIDFGYLGETTRYEVTGRDRVELTYVLEEAAENYCTTLQFEREKHGRTPWDT